jgi:hypothetical protein
MGGFSIHKDCTLYVRDAAICAVLLDLCDQVVEICRETAGVYADDKKQDGQKIRKKKKTA